MVSFFNFNNITSIVKKMSGSENIGKTEEGESYEVTFTDMTLGISIEVLTFVFILTFVMKISRFCFSGRDIELCCKTGREKHISEYGCIYSWCQGG